MALDVTAGNEFSETRNARDATPKLLRARASSTFSGSKVVKARGRRPGSLGLEVGELLRAESVAEERLDEVRMVPGVSLPRSRSGRPRSHEEGPPLSWCASCCQRPAASLHLREAPRRHDGGRRRASAIPLTSSSASSATTQAVVPQAGGLLPRRLRETVLRDPRRIQPQHRRRG